MAPEVLHGTPYDHTVDYWSLGCMLFETLVGYPPFAGQTPDDTWLNLRHWRKVLVRPVFDKGSGDEEFNLADAAWEFITKCITERKDRYQDIEIVMQDRYFTQAIGKTPGIDFDKIRNLAVHPLPPPSPASTRCLVCGWEAYGLAAVCAGFRVGGGCGIFR
jgi:serine/threonine protein kinase